jgi:hypothetical protein
MPVDQIMNPTAEESETYISGGRLLEYYQFDPAGAGTMPNGTLVSLQNLTSPSVGPALIRQSTTVVDFKLLGVVTNAPTGGYVPGQVVEVCVDGFCLALFDAHNTTAGHLGLQSVTTAGSLVDAAAAVLGQTMCVVLEAVTIGAGTALVPVYVHKM